MGDIRRDTLPGDSEHVRVLVIANAAKRNALDPALCQALAGELRDADRDGTRAIVLSGEGDKAFCAGFDLDALGDGVAADAAFGGLIDTLAGLSVPVIAALNGAALGGGCELAATCDLRVAHEGVTLGLPPARLGIVYPARGLSRLAALAGESRARQLFLTGRVIDARTALAWGLVDDLGEASAVLPAAVELAGRIAALAPLAVRGMRRTFELLVARRAALPAEDAAEIDRLRAEAWRSEDAAEALAAVRGKRKPVFKGA